MTAQPPDRPLRVAVIGNYPPDQQQSMQRYGALACDLLAAPDIEVNYHAPRALLGRLARQGALAKWLGYVDKFLVFPMTVARLARRADLVLVCDHSNALYCRFVRGVPAVVTCHDLLEVRAAAGEFAERRPGWTGQLLQRTIRSSLRHADHIVCVSEATRCDVERLIGPVPTTVIMNPLNYDYVPLPPPETKARLAAASLGERPYFLHVGGNQWYKNRPGVVTLFSKLAGHAAYRDHRLVLAGKPLPPSLRETIEALGLGERVVELVAPSNELINALYCGAEALLFPSFREGFGWPLVEAQAAGCPVVTSDRAPMSDITGPDGAVLIDPETLDSAAEAVLRARHDLDRYRQSGLQNVARLRRDVIAHDYRSLVRTLASGGCVPRAALDASARPTSTREAA